VDANPLWLVALVLAVAAPWVVRALQAFLERRLRRRTAAFLRSLPLDPERRRGEP